MNPTSEAKRGQCVETSRPCLSLDLPADPTSLFPVEWTRFLNLSLLYVHFGFVVQRRADPGPVFPQSKGLTENGLVELGYDECIIFR